ncbi:BrnA antitoxin family protein [Testudinibacter sp. P80/BLE/0925]|uniref:BrnA antitoxin family protein n=1 Tax=Testudinibacter sp. TW-1 TaxID=3417757 RepID=UPI003D36BA45
MNKISFKQEALPSISKERLNQLKNLADQTDIEIDTTEIPEQNALDWQSAGRGKFYKPTKTPVTVRFDSDILAWLKLKGKGYQTRMNAILREAMLNDLKNQRP